MVSETKEEERIEDTEESSSSDSWDEIELVSGRLVGISKARRKITLEVEEDPGHPVMISVDYHVFEEMSEEDLDDLSKLIGADVEAELHDGEVVAVWSK